jgi:hypothetical protein
MKRTLLPLAIALTLLCGFTLGWKQFRSAEGRFSVKLTTTPQIEAEEIESEIGLLPTHTFTATDKGGAFVVAYTDFNDSTATIEPAEILDGARNGVRESLNGTIVSEKEIKLNGHPGRDIVMTTDELQARTNIYLVGTRMYQVIAVSPKSAKAPKSFAKFFASFRLER